MKHIPVKVASKEHAAVEQLGSHWEAAQKSSHHRQLHSHHLCLEIRIKVKLHNSIVFTFHNNYHRTQSDTIGQCMVYWTCWETWKNKDLLHCSFLFSSYWYLSWNKVAEEGYLIISETNLPSSAPQGRFGSSFVSPTLP